MMQLPSMIVLIDEPPLAFVRYVIAGAGAVTVTVAVFVTDPVAFLAISV